MFRGNTAVSRRNCFAAQAISLPGAVDQQVAGAFSQAQMFGVQPAIRTALASVMAFLPWVSCPVLPPASLLAAAEPPTSSREFCRPPVSTGTWLRGVYIKAIQTTQPMPRASGHLKPIEKIVPAAAPAGSGAGSSTGKRQHCLQRRGGGACAHPPQFIC